LNSGRQQPSSSLLPLFIIKTGQYIIKNQDILSKTALLLSKIQIYYQNAKMLKGDWLPGHVLHYIR
jgi:hypothetical protein